LPCTINTNTNTNTMTINLNGEPTMNATEILSALSAPFEPAEIHWKPQAISGNRALAVGFIDARAVMDRLDAVCGLNWSDSYDVLPSGSVVCKLQVVIDGQTIIKCDVGSQSEQPDDGDKLKAAFSDALKRAAVKFGIGRYLYRLPKTWADYDAAKKQIKAPPQLPPWALPAKPGTAAALAPVAGGNGSAVTATEAKELRRLLENRREIDPVQFLALFGAARITELPRSRMSEACATLNNPPAGIVRRGVA
jgi:hypothetical protein